jgi:hypothetical protein
MCRASLYRLTYDKNNIFYYRPDQVEIYERDDKELKNDLFNNKSLIEKTAFLEEIKKMVKGLDKESKLTQEEIEDLKSFGYF